MQSRSRDGGRFQTILRTALRLLDAHVVSHTHWDREWYHPLERFRQRLVALVDELLERPPRPGESFLLDGQAVVLDDYLAVRPERQAELSALLAGGRLEAGPWYVLADELIPGGEAIVRNLLAGARAVRRLRGTPPPVLYCPDSFGHPATLPMIARGFGMELVILWRGYGSARWPAGDTVRWAAPDGSEVFLFHLPRAGYEFGSSLPADAGESRERWTAMRAELAPRATTRVVLIPNGADHHARQAQHDEAIAALAASGLATGDQVHASSIAAFAAALIGRASRQRLATVRGELRDSYGYTWTMQGTFGSRAHEKRLNARAERLLVREAEPFAALARWRGASRRAALLHAAWRDVLEAQPHDTLCGCSIDAVARAMELRLESARVQAAGIRDDALLDLIGHDASAAREQRDGWTPVVVLQNPAARQRSGVAIVQIEEFVRDVAVGPGSGSGSATRDAAPTAPANTTALASGIAGAIVQPLRVSEEHRRIESPRHYPDNDLVRVTEAAVWVDAMDGYGVRAARLEGDVERGSAELRVARVTARGTRMTNGLVSVEVAPSGAVSLHDHRSDRRLPDLFELLDEMDMGDLYTPSPRGAPVAAAFRSARIVRRGPLRGEMEIRYTLPPLGAVGHRRPRRAVRDLAVRLNLLLHAGDPFVRINVVVENQRDDHRLRLAIRTDVSAPAVHADATFDVVQRVPLTLDRAERAMEHAPAPAPLHRYVSLFDARQGATLYSDGLGEYEARSDGSVLVTLLRAVGELSRNDLPERPGHAGWPAPTPAAQCHGTFEARFALMLHGRREPGTVDLVERTADDVLSPITGFTLRSALAVPAPVAGVTLEGEGLAFSACKEAESGAGTVLRCVNLLDTPQRGRWIVGFTPAQVHRARLDETPEAELAPGSEIAFTAAPHEVVTIVLR